MDPNSQKQPQDMPPAYQYQQPQQGTPYPPPMLQSGYPQAPYPTMPYGEAPSMYPAGSAYPAAYPAAYPTAYPEPPTNQGAYPSGPTIPPSNAPTDAKLKTEQNSAGYPAPPPFSTNAPITQQPAPTQQIIIQQQTVGKSPQVLYCPTCQSNETSRVEHIPGGATWLSAGLCFCFGCWLCCCIPFCVDDLQDTEHRCPKCKNVLGVKKVF